MTGPLRLVVFDVDGTLIDSQDFIVEAMTRAFRGFGMDAPGRDAILSITGLSLAHAVKRLMPDLQPCDTDEVVQRYRDAFIALRAERGGEAHSPLYPGARAALDALHARDEVLMGVATGKARRGLDHACRSHGLDHYFLTRQTADDHPSKPHPSMLLRALSETGAEATNAVMVGDTSFDIEMGRAAGFKTIGVTWGYHPVEALKTAGADILIDGFHALGAALEQLWSE